MEYYNMFYNDTALSGSSPALTCAYHFFGPDHLLFGSDAPFDTEQGARLIRETIEAIEGMDISDRDKQKIFGENAEKLLHLPV
jgi:aminocarboxymuconate-semialdehyde decarboxylase